MTQGHPAPGVRQQPDHLVLVGDTPLDVVQISCQQAEINNWCSIERGTLNFGSLGRISTSELIIVIDSHLAYSLRNMNIGKKSLGLF